MNKKTNLQQKRLTNPRLVLWKTSLVFSKAKIMTWQSHYQTYTEGLECLCPPKDMSKNFIHTTQNLQTAPVPTLEEWKNKLVCYWYIVQSYNGYWKQNRQTSDICSSQDESQRHCVEQRKPDTVVPTVQYYLYEGQEQAKTNLC